MAKNGARRLIKPDVASSCYYRTSTKSPQRKALIQITEKCNLSCSHCFLAAGCDGMDMGLDDFQNKIIPNLQSSLVTKTSLTGGEPLTHPKFVDFINSLSSVGIEVGVCTNGTLVDDRLLDSIEFPQNVHFNVSLDGFSEESHGKFRGRIGAFSQTKTGIQLLGSRNLLKGILVTPNNYASVSEYERLCEFAVANRAQYVLFNPLSPMGRGKTTAQILGMDAQKMLEIRKHTEKFLKEIDIVYIRFPNDKLPLSNCEACNNFYVFANGDVTVCPYLVFAVDSGNTKYKREDFIVGNAFVDADINEKLDSYSFIRDNFENVPNPKCLKCDMRVLCGRGCPAAIIASGKKLDEIDSQVCPKEARY